MPRVRDLLLRFRPTGAPGPAGPSGVPVDRTGELAAELATVLAALAATEEECTALVEEGRREAGARRAHAAARADAMRLGAPSLAEAERSAASAAVLGAAPPGPANGTDARLAALDEHARAVAPRYLDHVSAVVSALCEPSGVGSPGQAPS
ncbi:hypothetical protein [Phycicoccus sp. 3266]|uniref:hypothetical protein n=1 Tax=Phycicoccus sp. 3266 TaxID=2817751 RepID=UPI002867764B|nr:hypothetical protein [Phycicoccus sp. 3266]MDR6864782.1 uncharacterized protein YciW [Phycicoccus sp. 3266]